MSPDVAARRTRWLVRVAVALVVATLIVTGALVYFAVGWRQMDAACGLESTVPQGASGGSVSFDWSWNPPGFACTWPVEDGADITVTKLWWRPGRA